jgi:hypothetical protein
LGYDRAVWILALTLLTCLSIDFSNPLLPGVVRFDDSESVYAVRAERPRTDERNAAPGLLATPGWRPTDLMVTPLRATRMVAERPHPLPLPVRPRGLAGPPPASALAGDDH